MGIYASAERESTTGISITAPQLHWKWVQPMVYNYDSRNTSTRTMDALQTGHTRRARHHAQLCGIPLRVTLGIISGDM